MRNAQGISMNVIIIAALALIVMVVLVMILFSKTRSFGAGVESCTDKGGECVSGFGACLSKGGATISGTECSKKEPAEVCCVVFKEGEEGK
jgi:hypothetical protein